MKKEVFVLPKEKMMNIKKTTLIFLFLLVFVIFQGLEASICLNDFDKVFPSTESADGSNYSLKNSMIDASAIFLQSFASANMMLGEGELADKGFFNVDNSLSFTNETIQRLELARYKYNEAYKTAKTLNYVNARIDQLKRFDYTKFAENSKLNPAIMNSVSGYLSSGDVTGLYKKNIDNIDSILIVLNAMKAKLEAGTQPDIAEYWDLLRKYSENLLFGNYATSAAREAFGAE